jgi:dTDP-4-dehydrorhamnose reductase
VFDGRAELVHEASAPNPVNFYGVCKFAVERELATMDELNYGVGRLAGVYGLNYAAPSLLRKDNGLGGDFVNFAVHQLLAGLPTPIWMGPKVNEVYNPTLASDGADMLLRLAKHSETGIFHCFGSEAIHRLAMAYQIAAVFELDRSLIAPVPTDPVVLDAHRYIGIPFRTAASTQKTSQALGRKAFDVLEGLNAFKQEWRNFFA